MLLGLGNFWQLCCIWFTLLFILALFGTFGAFEDLKVSTSTSSTKIITSLAADLSGEKILLGNVGF